MEGKSAHFTGETVVYRGAFHMEVPLDFHIIVHPDEDPGLIPQAAMVVSQFISEEYVIQKEAEAAEGAILFDDDEEPF